MRARRRGGWGVAAVVLAACGLAGMVAAGGNGSGAVTGTHGGLPGSRSANQGRPAKPIRLTVEVNGDLLIHSPVWEAALADGHGRYDFFAMLRAWTRLNRHATVTTAMFVEHAARFSDQSLTGLFDRWLWRAELPELPDHPRYG